MQIKLSLARIWLVIHLLFLDFVNHLSSFRFLEICCAFLQAMLRSDLPSYMVPFSTEDLVFRKPEVSKRKFIIRATIITFFFNDIC